ncbi:hypothetical protein QAD02_016340 [Eretmocerus hayati]|uniref:Uncharacterized protein n=1 Tax=Eretmocerus hayati TaxID=131215 RepID=A0ACC2PBT9_9HYME|nr:hypothetical protein QAD02_016340 [Eretmocerus hayati]
MAALIQEIHDDWASENISRSSHKIIEKNIKTARFLSYLFLVLYGFINISLLLESMESYMIGDIDKREFITPVYFYWDAKQSPAYELILAHQFIFASAGVYSTAIIEGQLAFMVLHACSKVHIVKEEIAKISHCGPKDALDPNDMHSIIKRISQKHLNFLMFTERIQDVYATISLVQLLCLTLLMVTGCFTLIVATEGGAPIEVVKYGIFVVACLFSSGLYCYVGEHLTSQGETIALEMTRCHWYEFPLIHQKNFNFILMRASIPVIMTAGKFSRLSLVLLTSISKPRKVCYFNAQIQNQNLKHGKKPNRQPDLNFFWKLHQIGFKWSQNEKNAMLDPLSMKILGGRYSTCNAVLPLSTTSIINSSQF